jgi:hypothetical protein
MVYEGYYAWGGGGGARATPTRCLRFRRPEVCAALLLFMHVSYGELTVQVCVCVSLCVGVV